MIQNYILVAFRNLVRNKIFSFINIIGLAIGLACSILIFLWVQDELSYDRFHEDGDRIYRIIQDIVFDDEVTWAITQGPLGPALTDDYPGIIGFNRITGFYQHLYFDEQQYRMFGTFTDSSFFDFFTIPLVKGDPATALCDPHSIVITESTANKIFGDQDPLDKMISTGNEFEFLVTGVVKDPPPNSIFDFEFLIPFHFADEIGYNIGTWRNSGYYSFLKLAEDISGEEMTARIADYLEDKNTLEENARLRLQPLTDIYLHSTGFDFGMNGGDIKYVYIFSIIAGFILVIACVNFMNLTTARASRRMKEIGVRKIMGAGQRKLILQVMIETLVLILVATILAIILVELIRPWFNTLSGKELKLEYFSPTFLTSLTIICIITLFLSGLYPALVIAGFNPINILKGDLAGGAGKSLLRRILVVFQFSISIFLIIATLVVDQQFEFLRSKDLGFDKENLVSIPRWEGMMDHYTTIRDRLLEHPDIVNVTSTARSLTRLYSYSNSLWSWEGKGDDEEILLRASYVDYDFFETLDIGFRKGRGFSRDFSSDTVNSIIINEEAARIMNMASPVGMKLMATEFEYNIIGVVRDFHYRSLHTEIEPLVIMCRPQNCSYLVVRIEPGANGSSKPGIQDAMETIEGIWNEYVKDSEFRYRFIGETIDRQYNSEKRIRQLARSFSLLAIIISCLGLFGLALSMTEIRTKEIGIRKANGASSMRIMLLLTKDFTKWVIFSFLIAFPVSWLAMSNWLQNFPYRISLSTWTFILAGLLAIFISWITVIYQAWQTAIKNPVESLHYE